MEPLLLASTIASTGLGAASSISQGASAYQSAQYQAKLIEAQSIQSRLDAGAQAQAELDKGARAVGSGIVAAAGQGGGFGGSALNVLTDLGQQSLFNARSAALSGVAESRQLDANATVTRANGAQAWSNGLLNAGSTILGGAMQLGQMKSQAALQRTLARGRG